MSVTLRYLRMSARRLLKPHNWKARLVFWGGAIVVGVVSALFALGSEVANEGFLHIIEEDGVFGRTMLVVK